jgi:hypothetical protein
MMPLIVTAALAFSVAVTLATSGCSANRTKLWPYSDDEVLEGLLARRAAAVCACLRAGTDLPPRRFTTDGCSMGPDGDWVGCCVNHDIEYWCGGSAQDRIDADTRLARCVERIAHETILARTMRRAVHVGGEPGSPFPWRWGYGWSGHRGFDAADNPGDAGTCLGR